MKPISQTMKTYTVNFSRVCDTLPLDTELTVEQVAAAGWLEEFEEANPDVPAVVVGISSFGNLTDEEMEFDMAVMLQPDVYERIKDDYDFAENVPEPAITFTLSGKPSDFKKLIAELIGDGSIMRDQGHPMANLVSDLSGQLSKGGVIDLTEIFKE